jgi:hypothetical protein
MDYGPVWSREPRTRPVPGVSRTTGSCNNRLTCPSTTPRLLRHHRLSQRVAFPEDKMTLMDVYLA